MRSVLIALLALTLFPSDNPVRASSKIEKDGEKASKNICGDPILIKARVQGLNVLTYREIPEFLLKSLMCKRHSRQSGQPVDFSPLYRQKQLKNYQEAVELSGPGSFWVTLTSLTISYSLAFHFLANK